MGNGRKTQTRSDPQRVRTEEWREANRRCQRQTTQFTEALCQTPPPPVWPNTDLSKHGDPGAVGQENPLRLQRAIWP